MPASILEGWITPYGVGKMQIAIDTSTNFAGIALAEAGQIFAEMNWRCGQNHSVHLLLALSFLLRQQGLEPKSATEIVVARGPGSYNGLRVGLSTVKGLAFSLRIPVVGISTMEVEAYQQAERGLPVCPVFNAGRGEIAAAVYQKVEGEWTRLVAEHVTTVETMCSAVVSPTVFCGEYMHAIAPRVLEILGDKAVFVSPAAGLRRAAYLVELGDKRLKAQDYDDPSTLQPLYLRAPPITEPKRR